jgi:hypothetical protein
MVAVSCSSSDQAAIDEAVSATLAAAQPATAAPTVTSTSEPVPTDTPVPEATAVPTPVPTPTLVPPTATPVSEPTTAPVPTPTLVPPTAVPTPTPAAMPTSTPTPTAVPTSTPAPTPTQVPHTLVGYGVGNEVGRTWNITEDTRWDAADGPFLITHTVRVDIGVILTIGSGAEVIVIDGFDRALTPRPAGVFSSQSNSVIEPLGSAKDVILEPGLEKRTTIRNLAGTEVVWFVRNLSREVTGADIPTATCENSAISLVRVAFIGLAPVLDVNGDYSVVFPSLHVRDSIFQGAGVVLAISKDQTGKKCEMNISNSTLIDTNLYEWSGGVSKYSQISPSQELKYSITHNCMINTIMNVRQGKETESNWEFRGNTFLGGSIEIGSSGSASTSPLNLNGNYWEPTADYVVTDQRDEELNLGDQPTKGLADYSDILGTPHPDTPVCSR